MKTTTKREIKLKIECQSCSGTGVYIGMGERDGASVVCWQCNGTGSYDYRFKYNEFRGRKKHEKAKRVFLKTYGYCIGVKPLTLSNGVFVDFSREGVSYDDFLNGKMPKHIKQMACPMIANQSACHKIPHFVDRCNIINGGYISILPQCVCKDKDECWKHFETGEVS